MEKEVKPVSREAPAGKQFNIWEAIAVMIIVILLAGVAAFTFTDYTEPPTVEGQTEYATFRLTGSVAVFLVVGAGILFGLKMIKAIMAPAFLLAAAFVVGPEFYHQDKGASGYPAIVDMEEKDEDELESEVMTLREENRMFREENLRIREINKKMAAENAIMKRNNAVLLDSIAVNHFDSTAVNITNFPNVVRAISERDVLIRRNDSLTAVNKRLQRIIRTRGILN